MKLLFKTAPVIVFSGAVLFCACSPMQHPTPPAPLVVSGTDSIVAIVPERDSFTKLGGTGYVINLREEYMIVAGKDSTFDVYPRVTKDTGCAQTIKFSFGEKALKVPGTRPVNFVPATLVGQQTRFTEFGQYDSNCKIRTGGAKLDSLYVQITCNAAPGEDMERLFGIALSLRKSTTANQK